MKSTSPKTDAELQQDVLDELRWDTRVNATDVGVSARDGVVTLTGAVDSWAKRHAAGRAAHRVAGATDVANDVTVRVAGAMERGDAELAKAAREALTWDVRVPGQEIETTVAEGVVTLEGTVSYWSQRADAEAAVRNLTGVQAVDNLILVAPAPARASDVRRAVAAALARQAKREAGHLDVACDEGRVTLTGTVRSWAEREAAVGAAGATPGVRDVVDRLHVGARS
jgi:osmotically-inducible protein OsmY